MKIGFTILTIWISSMVCAQTSSEGERLNILQKKGIEISTADIKRLNEHDFNLIKDYNFDQYRNEKSDRQIQLIKGPIAKVKSFNYCKENSIPFNESIYNLKKGEIENKTSLSIITQVNLGLGYKQNELNPENY